MSVRMKMILGCGVCISIFFATAIGIMAYSSRYTHDLLIPAVEPYMAVIAAFLAGTAGVMIAVKRNHLTKS